MERLWLKETCSSVDLLLIRHPSAIAHLLMLHVQWRMGFLNRRLYIPSLKAWGFPANFGKNPSNGGDGTVIHAYFNYLGANPDKFDHFKLTGENTFAVEDQFGGGDKDFNDLIVNMNFKTV